MSLACSGGEGTWPRKESLLVRVAQRLQAHGRTFTWKSVEVEKRGSIRRALNFTGYPTVGGLQPKLEQLLEIDPATFDPPGSVLKQKPPRNWQRERRLKRAERSFTDLH